MDIKKVIKASNDIFIFLLMIIFYYSVIGVASLVWKVSSLFEKKKESDSYWKTCHTFDQKNDYLSSY